MKQSTQQLIDKFWAGIATQAERAHLSEKLKEPENKWIEDLRQAYERQDRFTGPLTDVQSDKILMRLHRQLAGDVARKPGLSGWQRWASWAAAAVIVLMAGWGVIRFKDQTISIQVASKTQYQPTSPWQLTSTTNTSGLPQHLLLSDGSSVILQPGSSVSYYHPFGKASRDISMRGDVLFSVAKDSLHPFTVLANGITTTALGTQFRIKTPKPHQVSVKLIEGRVVVRSSKESHLKMEDTYLRPGDELSIDTRAAVLRIRSLMPVSNPVITRETPSVMLAQSVELSFHKEPLGAVLGRVSDHYKVPIDYDPADLQGLTFSGSFTPKDSIRIILNAICVTNNLSFTQKSGRIAVSRSQ